MRNQPRLLYTNGTRDLRWWIYLVRPTIRTEQRSNIHALSTDTLDPPTRDFNAPLRFPISNVFKGQTSGISVSGRVCGGIIVAGERLRIIPGDESATVKGEIFVLTHTAVSDTMVTAAIDSDGDSLPWAGAGSNVNVTLTGVDPISLNIGSVLCRPTHLIPLVSTFSARIIVFDIQVPITAGTSVSKLAFSAGTSEFTFIRLSCSTTLVMSRPASRV